MLVPWPAEPPGSSAQSGVADQNRRSAICQPRSKLDFILSVNLYLLPFKTKLLPRRQDLTRPVFSVDDTPTPILTAIRSRASALPNGSLDVVLARRYEQSEYYQFGYSPRAVTNTSGGVVS
jgi:hypothetical protein